MARKVHVDSRKLELTPRYINFDECLLLALSGDVFLNKKPPFIWASDKYEIANRREVEGIDWTSGEDMESEADG